MDLVMNYLSSLLHCSLAEWLWVNNLSRCNVFMYKMKRTTECALMGLWELNKNIQSSRTNKSQQSPSSKIKLKTFLGDCLYLKDYVSLWKILKFSLGSLPDGSDSTGWKEGSSFVTCSLNSSDLELCSQLSECKGDSM